MTIMMSTFGVTLKIWGLDSVAATPYLTGGAVSRGFSGEHAVPSAAKIAVPEIQIRAA
jgi:hypothetical protein